MTLQRAVIELAAGMLGVVAISAGVTEWSRPRPVVAEAPKGLPSGATAVRPMGSGWVYFEVRVDRPRKFLMHRADNYHGGGGSVSVAIVELRD